MKRIGYGKLGRSMPLTLDKCGNLGGDVECAAVIKELALRHPDDEFVLLGRNTGEWPKDVGLPDNVTNPWIEWQPELRRMMKKVNIKGNMTVAQHQELGEIMQYLTESEFMRADGHVWWVGQHGSSNTPIPMTNGSGNLTKPHDSYGFYAGYVFRGLNAWRDRDPFTLEEVYLNADARNRHKMRDLKWPLTHPVLTQYTFENRIKHERYGDDTHFEEFSGLHDVGLADPDDRSKVWQAGVRNVYSRLEVNGLAPGTPFGNLIKWNGNYDRPCRFGLFINEARSIGVRPGMDRRTIMEQWVRPADPNWVYGTWSPTSQVKLGLNIMPAPWDMYFPMLNSTRCTFTTPSSGSGWATAKPWEAFAAGTVCFFHPAYDDQDNILGDAPTGLRAWLRVSSPDELRRRIDEVNKSRETFEWLIYAQRAHFDEALKEKRYLRMIEERIYG